MRWTGVDPTDIFQTAVNLLAEGVTDRASPFHTPTVVTMGTDERPAARTVVLRDWIAASRLLVFHTDIRSPKIAGIRSRPTVEIHAYDPARRVQIRASGCAALHHQDQVGRDAWAATAPSSRQTYRVAQPPGTILHSPGDADLLGLSEADAFANFAVVRISVADLEFLSLASGVHHRVAFSWPDRRLIARWLVP